MQGGNFLLIFMALQVAAAAPDFDQVLITCGLCIYLTKVPEILTDVLFFGNMCFELMFLKL